MLEFSSNLVPIFLEVAGNFGISSEIFENINSEIYDTKSKRIQLFVIISRRIENWNKY